MSEHRDVHRQPAAPRMRALVADGRGSVTWTDAEIPEPSLTHAVIAVEAISVNRGETFQLESRPAGWRPGKDLAGVVEAPALSGEGPPAGARVVAHAEEAGWSPLAAVDVSRVVTLPEVVATTEAAALPLAGLTALRLGRAAHLSAGSTVLMTGASGGVGHYFAELAGNVGAHLTAVVGSRDRGARLRELGARTIGDLEEVAGSVDVGLDSIGGTSLGQVRARTDPHGHVIWFGQASRMPATLDFFDWVSGTTGAPITQFDYTDSDRPLRRDLATLVDLTATGHLHPHLDRVRPITEAAPAIEDLRHRRITGNLVLTWS